MGQFQAVYSFNIRRILRNPWLYTVLIFDLVFLLLYAAGSIMMSFTPFTFALRYSQQDMIIPLFGMLFAIYLFNLETSYENQAGDTYPVSNKALYLGLFASIYVAVFIAGFAAFSIMLCYKIIISGDFALLQSFGTYAILNLLNTAYFVSLGTLLVVLFKDFLPSVCTAFVFYLFNFTMTTFSFRNLPVLDLFNWSMLNNENSLSDFGLDPRSFQIVIVNRFFYICAVVLLLYLSYVLFKRYREARPVMKIASVLTLLSLICISCMWLYGVREKRFAASLSVYASGNNGPILPLTFNNYDIDLRLENKRLAAVASFDAINESSLRIPLRFYLSKGLTVRSVCLGSRGVSWKQKGTCVYVDASLPSKGSARCMVVYRGSMSEYIVQPRGPIKSYPYRRYAYIDADGAALPGNAGWYPKASPMFKQNNPDEFVLQKEDIPRGFKVRVHTDFPVISAKNAVFGSRNMECTTIGDVEYYHHKKQRSVIAAFDRSIRPCLAIMTSAVPMSPIQIVEVPANTSEYVTMNENGDGKILVSEALMLKAANGELMDWERDKLYESVFEGWFNTSSNDSIVTVEEYLWFMMDYILKSRNDTGFRKKVFYADLSKSFNEEIDVDAIKSLISFYEENGLGKVKSMLCDLNRIEEKRALLERDLFEAMRRSDSGVAADAKQL